MMVIVLASLIVIFTTIGQILLKRAALVLSANRMYLLISIAYTFFIIAVLLSYEILKTLELKYYTVIMSVNYIAVLVAAHYFLNEKITRVKLKGTLLIAIGIFIFLYNG